MFMSKNLIFTALAAFVLGGVFGGFLGIRAEDVGSPNDPKPIYKPHEEPSTSRDSY
jgi:hypothetical protein